MQVLLQVLTLFLLMLCGFFARKGRMMGGEAFSGLNKLVLYFAQPALILSSMQQSASPELIRDLAWVFVLGCAVMALSGFAASLLFRREAVKRRSVLTSMAMVSNCGFMGFPVITAALGEEALIYAVIYVAAFQLICWTLGAYVFGGRRAMRPGELFKNPSLLAVLGGLVLFLTGWRLPGFVNDGLSMMGSVTTPVAMFVIGSNLVGLTPAHLSDRPMLTACALRLVAAPLMVLLLRLTPLGSPVINSLFLCTAMPCAALTAMMAELYHADSVLASRGVAVSTALSMVTVPLLLSLI